MSSFIARQPIFNRDKTVYAYELLYREEGRGEYTGLDGDNATLNVMSNSLISIGMDNLIGSKKAFVNFTEKLIMGKIAYLFSKEQLVVELLENVRPTKEIIKACKELKNGGYIIALDDFVFQEDYDDLIDLADIIKLDFLTSSIEENKKIIKKYKNKKIKFLAEKIETIDDFNKALEMGCEYFQGYFFAKPKILESNTIVPYKYNYLKILKEIYREEPNFDIITEIIEHDVAFSYEIIRLVNSAAFYRKNKIKSVRQALVFMGIDSIQKWVYLATSKQLAKNKSSELISYSMIRLKFMEQMADRLFEIKKKSEYITLGMISLIDAIMDLKMEDALAEISLSQDIEDILLSKETKSKMALSYQLILKCERADISKISEICNKLGVNISEVADMYYDALKWAEEIILEN